MSSDMPPQPPPPPTGPPSSTEPPESPYVYSPQPTPGGGRTGLVIGIVIGAVVLVIGALVAAVVVLLSIVSTQADLPPYVGPTPTPSSSATAGADDDGASSIYPDALVTGAAGSPIATSPMNCAGACFDTDVIGSTIPKPATFAAIGVATNRDPWGKYSDTTAANEFDDSARAWSKAGGDPDGCFVAYPGSPISGPIDGVQTATDRIDFTGTHVDDAEISSIAQSTRLFPDADSASAYLVELDAQLQACSHYSYGSKETYWEADVSREPALNLPDSVAAVGWAEDSVFDTRYYAIDLQRGNIVVRTSLYTDGSVSEQDFRAFVEDLAKNLAEL
ncbi:hypothetical protein BH11ACT3_BH11ACT3_14230 [soil metagenome]